MLKDVTSYFSTDIHMFVLDEIIYHLNREKAGMAPFTWDCMTLINKLEENNNAHRKHYNGKECYGMPFPGYFEDIKAQYFQPDS